MTALVVAGWTTTQKDSRTKQLFGGAVKENIHQSAFCPLLMSNRERKTCRVHWRRGERERERRRWTGTFKHTVQSGTLANDKASKSLDTAQLLPIQRTLYSLAETGLNIARTGCHVPTHRQVRRETWPVRFNIRTIRCKISKNLKKRPYVEKRQKMSPVFIRIETNVRMISKCMNVVQSCQIFRKRRVGFYLTIHRVAGNPEKKKPQPNSTWNVIWDQRE